MNQSEKIREYMENVNTQNTSFSTIDYLRSIVGDEATSDMKLFACSFLMILIMYAMWYFLRPFQMHKVTIKM